MQERPLIVVGHKNPDTDSICAAIAYARFKTVTGTAARPFRAGNLNAQTRYVLERFGTAPPPLLTDVYPRLSDIMIDDRELITVRPQEPIGRARSIMLEKRFSFLPVTDDRGRCLGKVSLLGLAAAPEHLSQIRSGHLLTLFPEELLARTDGWTDPGKSLPARIEGIVVAPAIDGKDGESAVGPVSDGDRRTRLFITPAKDVYRILEGSQKGARRDVVIAYGAANDSSPGRPTPARSTPTVAKPSSEMRVLYIPRSLVETLVAIYESSPLESHLEPAEPLFRIHDLVRRTEREINRYNAGGFIVTDDEGVIRGVITRLNFLNQAQFRVVLVDHNELSQAVDGAEHAEIVEVIDHHRLGARSTEMPITFINRVVGSTCTIVADMYRSRGIDPERPLAGMMLSAILSDTVILKSPTATALDHDIASWLAGIAKVEIEPYGEEMFAAGSELSSTPSDVIIRQDQKIYEENGFKFAVSQIEMVGFRSFHERSADLASALSDSRDRLACDFTCLLVTDITRETSLLLFSGAPRVAGAIQYPKAGSGIYEMHGMLSRKKQLLPYILDVLKNL